MSSAATAGGAEVDKEPLPTVVTAKTLVADNRKRTVTYKTDVVVRRGDVLLYSDEVVITLSGEKKSGPDGSGELFSSPGSVEKIEAVGGVKIVQGDKTATAEDAVYMAGDEQIILTGNPRLWQGPNVLTGSSIVFDIKEDTITVEDAKTLLYQGGEVPGVRGGSDR